MEVGITQNLDFGSLQDYRILFAKSGIRFAVTSHASVHGDVTMALCRVTSCNGREGGEGERWAKKLSKLPTVMLTH